MAEIIKANTNKDGKVIVKLYGAEIDVTDKVKDGVAKFRKFGADYEVQVKPAKKIKVKAEEAKAEPVDVDYIETPIKG